MLKVQNVNHRVCSMLGISTFPCRSLEAYCQNIYKEKTAGWTGKGNVGARVVGKNVTPHVCDLNVYNSIINLMNSHNILYKCKHNSRL